MTTSTEESKIENSLLIGKSLIRKVVQKRQLTDRQLFFPWQITFLTVSVLRERNAVIRVIIISVQRDVEVLLCVTLAIHALALHSPRSTLKTLLTSIPAGGESVSFPCF